MITILVNKVKKKLKEKSRFFVESSIKKLISTYGIDTKNLFYTSNGILKYREHESGEEWFVKNVLSDILKGIDSPVLLDIGANVGNYSILLSEAFPFSRCYALEPNPVAFQKLSNKVAAFPLITPINIGAGIQSEELQLCVYSDSLDTEHASMYQEVFTQFHQQDPANLKLVPCKIDAIDNLIEKSVIPEDIVHFIKIDTEGHELEGLRGSIKTLQNRGVLAIQFEFNEMNIISRVFLKDFYDLLGAMWQFYRLDTNRLIPLGTKYDPSNEIFRFQNIIAVNSNCSTRLPVHGLS